jgi:hypothetical protein
MCIGEVFKMSNKFKPVESKDFPGFFLSSKHPEVAVSSRGEIVYLTTSENKIRKKGQKTFGTLSNGYRQFKTFCGEKNKISKSVLVHRVVMFAFYGPPPCGRKLDVNHKDGDRSNNTPENLEWCTQRENTMHSCTELENSNYARPILIKDVKTGLTRHFSSLSDGARFIGTFHSRLVSELRKNSQGVIYGRYLIKDAGDDSPWDDFIYGERNYRTGILIHNWLTGGKIIAASIREAENITGYKGIKAYLSRGLPEIRGIYYYTFLIHKDDLPSREDVVAASRLMKNKDHDRPIFWYDNKTKEFGVSKFSEIMSRLNITRDSMYRRLQHMGTLAVKNFTIKELWD